MFLFSPSREHLHSFFSDSIWVCKFWSLLQYYASTLDLGGSVWWRPGSASESEICNNNDFCGERTVDGSTTCGATLLWNRWPAVDASVETLKTVWFDFFLMVTGETCCWRWTRRRVLKEILDVHFALKALSCKAPHTFSPPPPAWFVCAVLAFSPNEKHSS